MEKRNVIQRYQFADYLDVRTEEKTDFVLMGLGFKTLNESPGAQTKSKKYVNEKASSKSVTGYETVFPVTSDLIKDEKAVIALYRVARNHATGSEAEFEYVRVELWDPVANKKNEFAARKFIVSAEISDISGDDDIELSGNLNAKGDPIDGTFNTETRTFTALTVDDGENEEPVV
ncbi:MAG: hypothetical protein HFF79_08140 [Oscillospiraceae bacterium]|nr:hypothetical protein [Oscillospiraceae bacterium]